MSEQSTDATMQVDKPALARASGIALVLAAIVLTLFVLPAEYGVDPTGAGRAMGIDGMATGGADDSPVEAGPASNAPMKTPDKATIARTGAWREDEMTIDLAPHSGKEIKAHMNAGDSYVFEWSSQGGPVKVDMHGEKPDAAEGDAALEGCRPGPGGSDRRVRPGRDPEALVVMRDADLGGDPLASLVLE